MSFDLPQGFGAHGWSGMSQNEPVTSFGHKHRPYLLSINAHLPALWWQLALHAVGVIYSQNGPVYSSWHKQNPSPVWFNTIHVDPFRQGDWEQNVRWGYSHKRPEYPGGHKHWPSTPDNGTHVPLIFTHFFFSFLSFSF